MEKHFDICIAGGGIAGACLAAYLGNKGIRIAVIEKSLAEQDRIIGELLQPGGVAMLNKMQLAHLLDGFDAQMMEGYGLFMNGEHFKIPYPKQAGQVCTGRGLRNGKFLQAIRSYAFSLPGVTVIEGTVTGIQEEHEVVTGVTYKAKGEEELNTIQATLTVVADGIFSSFRNVLGHGEKKVSGHFLGLLLKECDLPYPHHGHVIITDTSPMLVYPVSGSEVRVLIDFPGSEPPKKGEELREVLLNRIAPQIPEALQKSFVAAVEEGKFKVMPNHLMAARPLPKKGAVMLGDSLNMRHPLTGGGMTVAFSDVYQLGTLLMQAGCFADKQKVFEAVELFYRTRSSQSASINILADALYGVMSNDDLKQACFNYLKRGGAYAGEPVAILSAISRDVRLLIRHFFAVALYGMRTLLLPLPTFSRINRAYRMLADAIKIINPLLKNEKLPGLPRVLGFLF